MSPAVWYQGFRKYAVSVTMMARYPYRQKAGANACRGGVIQPGQTQPPGDVQDFPIFGSGHGAGGSTDRLPPVLGANKMSGVVVRDGVVEAVAPNLPVVIIEI